MPILRAGVHRIWTDNTVGVTPRWRVKSMVFARALLSVAFDSIIVAGEHHLALRGTVNVAGNVRDVDQQDLLGRGQRLAVGG